MYGPAVLQKLGHKVEQALKSCNFLSQNPTCMLQSSSWGKPENCRATNLERTFEISSPLLHLLYHQHQGLTDGMKNIHPMF